MEVPRMLSDFFGYRLPKQVPDVRCIFHHSNKLLVHHVFVFRTFESQNEVLSVVIISSFSCYVVVTLLNFESIFKISSVSVPELTLIFFAHSSRCCSISSSLVGSFLGGSSWSPFASLLPGSALSFFPLTSVLSSFLPSDSVFSSFLALESVLALSLSVDWSFSVFFSPASFFWAIYKYRYSVLKWIEARKDYNNHLGMTGIRKKLRTNNSFTYSALTWLKMPCAVLGDVNAP